MTDNKAQAAADAATQLTRATIGMHELYLKEAGGDSFLDKEGLAPVIMTDLPPITFQNWHEADATLLELEGQLASLEPGLRRDYLAEMVDSLRALIVTFRGEPLSYRDRIHRFLRVTPDSIPDEQLQGWTGQIDRMLNGLGYDKGSLGERIHRWESDNQVPPDEVLPALKRLMDTARVRTVDMMFPLPDDAIMDAVGIHGVPFGAYSDYPGRKVLLNIDQPYTHFSLKRLACHEGFPGHCAHMALRDARTHSGEMPVDGALVVTNSASSPLFEGIADFGIEFIDWLDGPADELATVLGRLRGAARINTAMLINAEGKSLDEASAYQARVSFMSQSQAASRLGFLTHKLRAPFAFAYWYGDRAVERVWRTVTREQRPRFFEYLYGHMHTPTTLYKYWTGSGS
jgi:hypothetical protein